MAVLKRFLPYHYVIPNSDELSPGVSSLELDAELLAQLPIIVQQLEGVFYTKWMAIKDDLIIYEIEEFCNELSNYIFDNSCQFLNKYCRELNLSLQSFDIDLIEKKLAEYPNLIEKLKSYI